MEVFGFVSALIMMVLFFIPVAIAGIVAIVGGVVGVVVFALWLWMLVDAIQREESLYNSKDEKVLWILILLLGGWIGALVYYVVYYSKQDKSSGDMKKGCC